MAKAISSLVAGDLVETPVNEEHRARFGDTIVWRIAAKNHTGYPANSVTLIADRIIQVMAFDAKEANNPTTTTKTYGYNRYLYSNIHQWLNSSAKQGWFTAQHAYDAAPTATTVNSGNHYADWPGFLAMLPAAFTDKLLTTTLVVAKSSTYDGGGSDTFTAKAYLASTTEVGAGVENGIAEGAAFGIFSNNYSRIAYPTYFAAQNANGYSNDEFNEYYSWQWALRSLNPTSATLHRSISVSGAMGTVYPVLGTTGIRPVCNVPAETYVSDSPNNRNVYTLLVNQAPQAPSAITVPASVQSGTAASISWNAATDADGNLSGYRLERDVGNASWTQIYQGTARSYGDTVSANWDTVQYRVKAYDAYGEESGYAVSATRAVSKNTAPAAPSALTVPTGIRGGASLNVSWNAANDAEGNLTGYVLERSLDGGSFSQIYKGAALSYVDFIAFGTVSVAYRVKAYDSYGLESGYLTGLVQAVVNNVPPEAPPTITVPEIRADSPTAVLWGTSSDSDGNLAGYLLERSVDGGDWMQIYKGNLNGFTDPPSGEWTTAQYRVRAYDAVGDESGNRVAAIRIVNKKKPPSAPSDLRLLNKAVVGFPLAIKWEKAVSFEGGNLAYCLERAENGGAFAAAYTGEKTSFEEPAPNAQTLQYRVKALDSISGESAYAYGAETSVIVNNAPVISGEDAALGLRNNPFNYAYSVGDLDGDAVVVTESLDDQVLREYAPILGAEQSFTMDGDALLLLSNGEHALTIRAEDVNGLISTRTVTFTKDVPYVRIERNQPMETDSTPLRANVAVERSIPEGALYAVEATNNPFDAEPVWENITALSRRELTHVFRNKTNESQRFGLNVRVTVARNGAEGECWVSKVSGSFE